MKKSYLLNHVVDEKKTTKNKIVFTKEYNGLVNFIKEHNKKPYRLKFAINEDLSKITGYVYGEKQNGNGLIITCDDDLLVYHTDAEEFVLPDSIMIQYEVQPLWGFFTETTPKEMIFYKEIDFTNVNTKNMTDMSALFMCCTYLENIIWDKFSTDNVKKMWAMFSTCTRLKKLDLDFFNTKNVENMRCMFAKCFKLKEINIESFDFRNVTNISECFVGDVCLSNIKYKKINFSKMCNTDSIFFNTSFELKPDGRLKFTAAKKELKVNEIMADDLLDMSFDNRDYSTIMTDIFLRLSGDVENDMAYLESKKVAYKNHEFSVEIARECGRKIAEIMPNDMKKDFDKVYSSMEDGFESMIEQVIINIKNGNVEKAEKLLLPVFEKIKELEKINFGHDDKVTEYIETNEPFEEALYKMRFKPKKELKPRVVKYGEIYYFYGYLLVEKGDIKNARDALKKAVDYAPVKAQYAHEYCETFKSEYHTTHNIKSLEKFYNLTKETFKISYKPIDIARCYRNLAYYFVEKKMYNEAVICHLLGAQFSEDTTIMQSELFYISQISKNVNLEPEYDDIIKFCKKYDIPEKCDPDIQKLADDGVAFILRDDVEPEIKEYYSKVLMPILSNEMNDKLIKMDFIMSTMKKNDESLKKHKVYSLNEIKKVKEIKKQSDVDIDKLDTVKFGKYQQNLDKKSDVEWIVLERDNEKTLLMSKYILDCKVFDKKEDCISWEKCSLRKWLNKDFINEAFTKEEQKLIIETNLNNNFNSKWENTKGNETIDKVFCLATSEIEKYYKDEKKNKNYYLNKFLATRTTAYVISNSNIYVSDERDEWYVGNSYYWTRSTSKVIKDYDKTVPGSLIMPVNEDGTFAGGCESNSNNIGVRPVMWVKI